MIESQVSRVIIQSPSTMLKSGPWLGKHGALTLGMGHLYGTPEDNYLQSLQKYPHYLLVSLSSLLT